MEIMKDFTPTFIFDTDKVLTFDLDPGPGKTKIFSPGPGPYGRDWSRTSLPLTVTDIL